jgi:hypothetical protein
MTHSNSIPSDERIVDAMIQLARPAKLHRMVVAGSNSPEIFLELHRRGHLRVASTQAFWVAGWRPLSEQVLSPPSFMLGGRK